MKHARIILFCLLAGCAPENHHCTEPSEQLEAINQVRNNHVKAVNNSDVELLLKDMSPDIVYLAPGTKPITGIKALEEFVTAAYQELSSEIEMIPSEVIIRDSVAVEWGLINGTMSLKSKDTTATSFALNYLFVYEKSKNGRWLITRDIYNFSE